MKDSTKVGIGLFILFVAVFLKVTYFQDTLAISGSFSKQCSEEYLSSFGKVGSDLGEFSRSISRFAVSPFGFVYAADPDRLLLYKFSSDGRFLTSLGGQNLWLPNSSPESGRFSGFLSHIEVAPDGLVYVSDVENRRIQVFDDQGTYVKTYGDTGKKERTTDFGAFFPSGPREFVLSEDGSVLVAADVNRPRLLRYFTTRDDFQSTLFGSAGKQNGQFRFPVEDFVIWNDQIFVHDYGNKRIQVFDLDGNYLRKFGWDSSDTPYLGGISGDIAVAADGSVFVVDTAHYRVLKFNPEGMFLSSFGSQGKGDGAFSLYPGRMKLDHDGNVWVVDRGSFRIHKFNPQGEYLLSLGGFGHQDGLFSSTNLDLAFDTFNNLYVLDPENVRIHKFGKLC